MRKCLIRGRGQIDVKYVPSVCLVGEAAEEAKENRGYNYQYTFIDEYSRFRYLEAFKDHNTYSSTVFLKHVVENFLMLLSVSKRIMDLNLRMKWATARKTAYTV